MSVWTTIISNSLFTAFYKRIIFQLLSQGQTRRTFRQNIAVMQINLLTVNQGINCHKT